MYIYYAIFFAIQIHYQWMKLYFSILCYPRIKRNRNKISMKKLFLLITNII